MSPDEIRRLHLDAIKERARAADNPEALAQALVDYAEAALTPIMFVTLAEAAPPSVAQKMLMDVAQHAANMGSCSQAHHEYIARDARDALRAVKEGT